MGHPFDFHCLRQCFYCRGLCNVDQDRKNPYRWIPACLLSETEEKHKNEDGTDKKDAIETDYYARFVSRRSLLVYTKKEIPNDIARRPLESHMKLINLICDNVEDLVVVSAHGYRSEVFFCDSSIATLKTIKDENEEVNQEAALDVVTKHFKKYCSLMENKRRTYPTKVAKDIADKSTPDVVLEVTKETVYW